MNMPGMKPAAKDAPENFRVLDESLPPLLVEAAVVGAGVAWLEEVEEVRREADVKTAAADAVLEETAELVLMVAGKMWHSPAWHE